MPNLYSIKSKLDFMEYKLGAAKYKLYFMVCSRLLQVLH